MSYSPLLDAGASTLINSIGMFMIPVALRGGADSTSFTFVRRIGDFVGALYFLLSGGGGAASLAAIGKSRTWGSLPLLAPLLALASGFANTAASLLTQRAQVRGVDPGTATSIQALYPALLTLLSVIAGFEKMSPLKFVGLLLAIGSGVCFARSK